MKASPQRAFFGKVYVMTKVFGFFKIRNKQILDSVDVDTPPWERNSTGMWFDVPSKVLAQIRERNLNAAEAIHSAQHAFLNQFAMAADLKTECKAAEKEYKKSESSRKRPARLVFYDTPGKGGEVAVKAFDHVYDILSKASIIVETCDCEEGCTNCILSPACKEHNSVFSKVGALIILKGLLDLDISLDEASETNRSRKGFDTIIEADTIPSRSEIHVEPAE